MIREKLRKIRKCPKDYELRTLYATVVDDKKRNTV